MLDLSSGIDWIVQLTFSFIAVIVLSFSALGWWWARKKNSNTFIGVFSGFIFALIFLAAISSFIF